jgi:hypothetical protein
VVTSSLREDELTGVAARKVVALEILYRTMDEKASSRLIIMTKTLLKRLYVGKIFEKSDLASVNCLDNLLWRARIEVHTIENSFLYLLVQESLSYLLVCVRHGRNKETL